jgi:hypothetical protein
MRLLTKFTLPTAFNPSQRTSLRFSPEYEAPPPLWFSVTLPPKPRIAVISRTPNPPSGLVCYKPVATPASALGSRPAFVEVKPQTKKRKHHDSAGSQSDLSDDYQSDSDNGAAADENTQVSPLAKRQRTSALSSASLLLASASARPENAIFSMGQVAWAKQMLHALIEGQKLYSKQMNARLRKLYSKAEMPATFGPPGVDVEAHPWVTATKLGAEMAEKEYVFVAGEEGLAGEKELENLDRLLSELGLALRRNEGLRKAVEKGEAGKENVAVSGDVVEEGDTDEEVSGNEEMVEAELESSSDQDSSESSDEE